MTAKFQWIIYLVLIVLLSCTSRHAIKDDSGSRRAPVPKMDQINHVHNSLSAADSLYAEKQYQEALPKYQYVFDHSPHLLNRPELFFKMGFCYYSIEKPDSAIFWMHKAYRSPDFHFSDYTAFLMGEALRSNMKYQQAWDYYSKCVNGTQNEYLRNKALWEMIWIKEMEGSDSLAFYLDKVRFSRLLEKKEDYILLKIRLLKEQTDSNALITFAERMLKSDWHAFVEDTLVSVLLQNYSYMNTSGKVNALKILMNKPKNQYFDNWYLRVSADKRLNREQRSEVLFQKAVKLYKMRKWQSASQMLHKMNSKHLPSELRGDYALYVARCNARKGFQNTAIRAYYNFQKKYPRHRLAGDALWWIALTFEQRNDVKSANKYYNILSKKYFNKNVGKEARFRLIFNEINRGRYASALKSIRRIIKKVDYNDKMRLNYWQMICLQKLKRLDEAAELKETLLKDPFQNYYTMKTFLTTYADSLSDFRELAPFTVPSHYTLEPELQEKINRIFYIQEIMGEQFARLEIRASLSSNSTNKNYRLILAELNKKMGNYGEAYKLNRRNYEKYFMRKNWREKIGYIKTLYPLYYDDYIYPLAYARNVDPLFIYALMKRESLFQARVKSYANAYGLMQILPSTARVLAKKMKYKQYREPLDLYEPEVNINLGIYYLQNLLEQFDGSLPQVLASYNAGESRVERWEGRYLNEDNIDIFIELIPIDQTRKYVKYILYYYYVYQWFYRLEQGICYYQPLNYPSAVQNQ